WFGPGLPESAYEAALAHELRKRGYRVETQVSLPVHYDGVRLDAGYRIDMIVNDELILELKSVEELSAIHKAQLITYLKLSGITRGLLLNFNVELLKEGIFRAINSNGAGR